MSQLRSALIDLSAATSGDADTLSYLSAAGDLSPTARSFAPKPVAVDDHDDSIVNTAKWTDINVSVTEGEFIGRDCLIVGEGSVATPDYDEAGVIYKTAIPGTLGTTVFARFVMEKSCDFLVGLQDFDYTETPQLLKHLDPANTALLSTALEFSAGAVYVVRGGAAGTRTRVTTLPAWRTSDPSVAAEQYIIQVAITFTSTGHVWRVSLPGVNDDPVIVHTEVRSSEEQPDSGYAFCVNKYSTADQLGFYNLSVSGFLSNVALTGGKVVCADESDVVKLASMTVDYTIGGLAGGTGTIYVRFPSLDSPDDTELHDPAEISSLLSELTGANEHPIDIILSGDVVFRHPARVNVLDQTLTTATAAAQ